MSQLTFDDIRAEQSLRQLTGTQRRILGYIAQGCFQAIIAERLKVSRSYVSKQIKYLISLNLIQRVQTHPKKPGIREYTHLYELSPDAKAQLTRDPLPIQSWHVHHIGIKYRILRQSGPPSRDKRIADDHPKVWKMKGWEKLAYWYRGKAGAPAVTVYVNPTCLIVWMDKHQLIAAPSIEDAERLADQAIADACEKFKDQQRLFRVVIETDNGSIIGKRHYGAMIREDHPDAQKALAEGINCPGWHVDRSPDDKIPGMAEAETYDLSKATGLETVINLAPEIQKIAGMPDLIRDTISPINAQLIGMRAMMQGEVTMQTQYEQMVKFMTAALTEMQAMRKELEELRERNGR